MPNDFKESKRITLRVDDTNIPYTFQFPICSSATANDGAVPYGLTIASHTVKGHLSTTPAVDASTALINTSILSGTTVTVKLKYPVVAGIYHLVFKLTFSDASVKDYVFEKVDVV
jgi:hypothetical protein